MFAAGAGTKVSRARWRSSLDLKQTLQQPSARKASSQLLSSQGYTQEQSNLRVQLPCIPARNCERLLHRRKPASHELRGVRATIHDDNHFAPDVMFASEPKMYWRKQMGLAAGLDPILSIEPPSSQI